MSPDEAADLIQSLRAREIQGSSRTKWNIAKRNEVESLLRFDENTAGGMMNTEIVVVGEDATRGEVIDYIRFHDISPDQLDNIVLINREAALVGNGARSRAWCSPKFGSAHGRDSFPSRCSR